MEVKMSQLVYIIIAGNKTEDDNEYGSEYSVVYNEYGSEYSVVFHSQDALNQIGKFLQQGFEEKEIHVYHGKRQKVVYELTPIHLKDI
jgi:glucose-6-phosphate isomerase